MRAPTDGPQPVAHDAARPWLRAPLPRVVLVATALLLVVFVANQFLWPLRLAGSRRWAEAGMMVSGSLTLVYKALMVAVAAQLARHAMGYRRGLLAGAAIVGAIGVVLPETILLLDRAAQLAFFKWNLWRFNGYFWVSSTATLLLAAAHVRTHKDWAGAIVGAYIVLVVVHRNGLHGAFWDSMRVLPSLATLGALYASSRGVAFDVRQRLAQGHAWLALAMAGMLGLLIGFAVWRRGLAPPEVKHWLLVASLAVMIVTLLGTTLHAMTLERDTPWMALAGLLTNLAWDLFITQGNHLYFDGSSDVPWFNRPMWPILLMTVALGLLAIGLARSSSGHLGKQPTGLVALPLLLAIPVPTMIMVRLDSRGWEQLHWFKRFWPQLLTLPAALLVLTLRLRMRMRAAIAHGAVPLARANATTP